MYILNMFEVVIDSLRIDYLESGLVSNGMHHHPRKW